MFRRYSTIGGTSIPCNSSCVLFSWTASREFRSPASQQKGTLRGTNRKVNPLEARSWVESSRLARMAPQVAAEWDYDKNPMTVHPLVVGSTAIEPRWWRCAQCNHSYEMPPERRTLRGCGCPKCAEQKENVEQQTIGGIHQLQTERIKPKFSREYAQRQQEREFGALDFDNALEVELQDAESTSEVIEGHHGKTVDQLLAETDLTEGETSVKYKPKAVTTHTDDEITRRLKHHTDSSKRPRQVAQGSKRIKAS